MLKFDRLYEQYKSQVDFLNIYISEAHAKEEWALPNINGEKWNVSKPTTTEERLKLANDWVDDAKCISPYFVDPIDDAAGKAYAAAPERLYIIRNGKIAYKGGEGPFYYDLDEVIDFLNHNLHIKKRKLIASSGTNGSSSYNKKKRSGSSKSKL